MNNPFRYGSAVEGEFFCARPELERQLRDYAKAGQNLVIYGERRMGKTSLVRKVIGALPGARLLYIDLYYIRSLSDFCKRVMNGVADVKDKASFLNRAMELVSRLRPTLGIDARDGTPVISIDERLADRPESLRVAMGAIEKLAAENGLCVVFDEFQDVLKVEENPWGILAEMRSTIQFQGDTPYFYLGSVRNEMLRIFSDPDSPFFKSALPIEVGPIDVRRFADFICSRFAAGNRVVKPDFAARIIAFADGVSGDVQELCDALWERSEPGAEVGAGHLEAAMDCIFSREGAAFETALLRMTPVQMRVLRSLAWNPTGHVFSREFMEQARMTNAGAMKKAITRLVTDRLLFIKDGAYRFFNPFFREWIKERL